MIGVAIGVLTAAVPFVLSRLLTGGSRDASGGLFRTHTMRPSTEPVRASSIFAPSNVPIVTRTELPPATMPLIDPWASEHTAQAVTPTPAPTPPPFVMDPALAAQYAALSQRNAAAPNEQPMLGSRAPVELAPAPTPLSSVPSDGPGQTQLPTMQDLASLPAPPPPPEPPPFVESTQATDERPPQERGELPAELATLPPATPTADTPPEGYDPIKAKNLAKQVASNITNRGVNYSRGLLKDFQRFAGIQSEGIYGGESRGALEFFGVRRPPRALFKPVETVPYRWATWS